MKVDGYFYATNISAKVAFTLTVDVQSFQLNSTLASAGPHSFGSKPTTISLDILNVDAKSTVLINGEIVELNWTPFFLTYEHELSSCTN